MCKGELLKGRVSVRVSACQRCLCVYVGPSAVGPHFSAVPRTDEGASRHALLGSEVTRDELQD